MAKEGKLELVHKVVEVVTTDSMTVGEVFGKEHFHVIRDIKELECSNDFKRLNFIPMEREINIGNGAVRKDPFFEITRNGFFILAMGYTGKKAMEFKEAYIAAFDKMAEALREREANVSRATAAIAPRTPAADMLAAYHGSPLVRDGVEYWPMTSAMDMAGYKSHPGRIYRWLNRYSASLFPADVYPVRMEYGRTWVSAEVAAQLWRRRAAWDEYQKQLGIKD